MKASILLKTGLLILAWGQALAAPKAVRFLIPQSRYSETADQELYALVQQYNSGHPGVHVELVRRGSDYSSLKELVAFQLAGDTPEIAVIETSELPVVESLKITRPIGTRGNALPFRQTLPILIADQEALFRAKADPNRLPESWNGLVDLLKQIAKETPDTQTDAETSALALPLQGPLGLWVFETLASRPLWTREIGGLKTNRALQEPILELQKLLDRTGLAHPEETWDRSLQSFLDRKSALLVSSLDLLPYISKQATFRWIAAPLPAVNRKAQAFASRALSNNLVITKDAPEVLAFLDFLYAPSNAARWLAKGSFLPLKGVAPDPSAGSKTYLELLKKLPQSTPRTTDREAVRSHSEWVQALRLLFGEKSRRIPSETVLIQLDGKNLTLPR